MILGPPAKVHILVIQEEIAIEPAKLLKAIPAQQLATAGNPWHLPAPAGLDEVILAPFARQRHAGECLGQRGKRTRRKLPRAIAVEELKSDDAGTRFVEGQAVRQGKQFLQEILRNRDVWIQEKDPF